MLVEPLLKKDHDSKNIDDYVRGVRVNHVLQSYGWIFSQRLVYQSICDSNSTPSKSDSESKLSASSDGDD